MMLLILRKINNHSLCSMLLFVCLALFTKRFDCTENENLCYVCGSESLAPLIEFNKTYTTIVEKSCEHFDKLLSYEREAYKILCPQGLTGCITKIQSNNVMRTCSEKSIDDCKKVNDVFVCICSQNLCNGEISDNIKKTYAGELFDQNEEEDDNEDGDDDIDEQSGDDVIQFSEDTTNIIDSSSSTNETDEVLMSTISPSINKAVSFHFKNQLKLFYVLIFLQSFKF